MTELTVDLKPGFELLTLERRLADTPADAHVRGLFFRLAEQALSDRSQDLVATWRAASGARMRWPFKMYSTREFIREQAIAAVLLDPGDPGGELRKMWAATPKLSSLIRAEDSSAMTRRKPEEALSWLSQNRKMMCDYGSWQVDLSSARSAVFYYDNEYTWIEHAHRGGVEGTLQRCGVTPTVTVELEVDVQRSPADSLGLTARPDPLENLVLRFEILFSRARKKRQMSSDAAVELPLRGDESE